MTTNNTPSMLLALPEDLQRRLFAGCRYEDLFSLGAACRAVRDVVNSPRFTNARLAHGFAERTVVLVGTRRPYAVDIRSAQTRAASSSRYALVMARGYRFRSFSSTSTGCVPCQNSTVRCCGVADTATTSSFRTHDALHWVLLSSGSHSGRTTPPPEKFPPQVTFMVMLRSTSMV